MSRAFLSIRNIKYSIIGQIIGILISLLSRVIFIKILGLEYLGVSGLFTNILYILSFAELGVGNAIIYSLYRPLAEYDITKIKSLMKLYRKAYLLIGSIIMLLEIAFIPFLGILFKDMPDIPHLKIIYLLFVINSAVSYLFSFKKSLIIADQKRYIVTLYRYVFYFILNVLQVVILLLTHSFILFLILQIISTLVENLLISKKADKLYPFLLEKVIYELDINTTLTIKRNVKALIFHKVGDIVISNSDNILLSKLIGLKSVGIYANYILITNALNTVFGSVFQAITASIGNLGATESDKKSESIFDCINFLGFWIYGFASICLFVLLNPFIELWLGKEYLFSEIIVISFLINFYLTGMRRAILTFRDAFGLYWFDRYKPLIESLVKISLSIFLIYKIGIIGAFIGTSLSTILTCFWMEPYVLYKYGFHSSLYTYFKKYIIYTLTLIFAGTITWFSVSFFNGSSYLVFVLKLINCLVIPNLIFFLVFKNTSEFRYIFYTLKSNIKWIDKIAYIISLR